MSAPNLNPDALRRHLALVMLFGAARADSTPDQLDGLRDLVELMRDPAVPLGDVARGVLDVMGPDWCPTGEWADVLEGLLDDRPTS